MLRPLSAKNDEAKRTGIIGKERPGDNDAEVGLHATYLKDPAKLE